MNKILGYACTLMIYTTAVQQSILYVSQLEEKEHDDNDEDGDDQIYF